LVVKLTGRQTWDSIQLGVENRTIDKL